MWLTPKRKIGLRQSIIWVGVLALVILFREVYYYNSHGRYSDYMTYVWIGPSILLSIYVIFAFLLQFDFGEWGRLGLNAGVGTIALYQIIRGIYEIARVEPENSIDVRWSPFFLVVGILALLAGASLSIIHIANEKKNVSKEKETL